MVEKKDEKDLKLKEDENVEENIIKDVRNLFRLDKRNEAIKYRIINDISNLLSIRKRIVINQYKQVIFRDIKNLFEPEEEYCFDKIKSNNKCYE